LKPQQTTSFTTQQPAAQKQQNFADLSEEEQLRAAIEASLSTTSSQNDHTSSSQPLEQTSSFTATPQDRDGRRMRRADVY
jgi:hypothetical protein